MDYGNAYKSSMNRRLGSAALWQLAFPWESHLNFSWKKSQWNNSNKRTTTTKKIFLGMSRKFRHLHVVPEQLSIKAVSTLPNCLVSFMLYDLHLQEPTCTSRTPWFWCLEDLTFGWSHPQCQPPVCLAPVSTSTSSTMATHSLPSLSVSSRWRVCLQSAVNVDALLIKDVTRPLVRSIFLTDWYVGLLAG